jgi:hypothetical protein
MKLGRFWVLTATMVLVVSWGCDAVSRNRDEFAVVKGKVKLKGKLLEGGGMLNYVTQLGKIKAAGPEVAVQQDGTYQGQARVGTNYVTVHPRPVRGRAPKSDEEVTVEVKSGVNEQDLEFNH